MLIYRTIAIVLLLFATAANGSFWVSNFDGPAEAYGVIRNDAPIALEQLMLLHPGDIILIKKSDGKLIVIDQQNEHHNLTPADTPFVVPESDPPPKLLANVHSWVASWWNTRGNQNTSSMAAVSRGSFEPIIVGADDGDMFLLSGARKLHVAWNGGIPPFNVTLNNESGKSLVNEPNLPGYSASLSEVLLEKGHYNLTVAAGDDVSRLTLVVVDSSELPNQAREILGLAIPDEIRFGHIAMVLSGYAEWRFEALQLAHRYGLTNLELDLLTENFPASDIDQMASRSETSQSDQQVLPHEN